MAPAVAAVGLLMAPDYPTEVCPTSGRLTRSDIDDLRHYGLIHYGIGGWRGQPSPRLAVLSSAGGREMDIGQRAAVVSASSASEASSADLRRFDDGWRCP